MNIVDIIIIVVIILGALTGFIRGFFKETVMFLGTILVVVLAFILKNPLSVILYENLPFFGFGGITSLNILLYEVFAFIIALSILAIALTIVIKISGILENILRATVVLALPTKLLGLVVGAVRSIVILYVILYIASLPVFRVPLVNESKYSKLILTKTPIISNITEEAVKTFEEIYEFTTKEIDAKDIDKTNRAIIEVMLKNKVVTAKNVKLLSDNKKIEISNLDELLEKYKEVK